MQNSKFKQLYVDTVLKTKNNLSTEIKTYTYWPLFARKYGITTSDL